MALLALFKFLVFDDRNFCSIYSSSISNKMTKTRPNTKENLKNRRKAQRRNKNSRKTIKSQKRRENAPFIVVR
jgi:hypothetical protein